ncbi:MAG: prolyl oligopeptidase family serine peptidase, partial [Clostridia bacterium]|nr:prolyl oligopeptidase family serine peptidase [Clostridia bacterium]
MKRTLSFLLTLLMLVSSLPLNAFIALAQELTAETQATAVSVDSFRGKTVSILSHSASTYDGVSNNTAYNSTIGDNDVYYTEGRHGVYRKDTWWQQVIDVLDMRLLVNNSWSGSCVLQPRKGEASVTYKDRAVNLHNDHTGEEPDIIWVYIGGNDFAYYKDTYGKAADVDYDALIKANGDGSYTYAEPTTTCEAYAITLHKAATRYPEAEIYCITSTARREVDYTGDSYPDAGQPTEYSAQLWEVAAHFGYPVVDLEKAIPKDVEIFDSLMGDKRAHPNAEGMDRISEELLSVMLGREVTLQEVTGEYDGVTTDHPAAAAIKGEAYKATLTPEPGYSNLHVTVTMGGEDVTQAVYADGKITVAKVTGDLMVTAKADRKPLHFRWEMEGTSLRSLGDENALTALGGTVTDGVITGGRYQAAIPMVLKHDRPWVLEWKCGGDWRGAILTSAPITTTVGKYYLSRTKGGQLCFGAWSGSQYDNYGVDLSALDAGTHTFRLENRISADGSNMIYLSLDGGEALPMNNYFVGSKAQNTTSNWVSGKDFSFGYLGTDSAPLNDCKLEYLLVCEDTSLSLSYDDRYDVAGKEVEILDAGKPTSYQVGYGVAEGTLDTAVVTLNGDKLIATGIGTAKVKIDGVTYTVTVKATPISLIMITGHSMGAGQKGSATQSVICPEGQVYSSHGTTNLGSSTTGVGISYAALTKAKNVNAFTLAGEGTIGEGSALAWEYNRLTGEKVWVLNTAVGGSNLSEWIPGTTNYKNAVAQFRRAQAILSNEIRAGHYTLSDMGILYHNGANFGYKGTVFTQQDLQNWYDAMWNGFKTEFSTDLDGNGTNETASFLGLVPIWTKSGGVSYTEDEPAGLFMAASDEYPDIFTASVIGRDWLTNANVAAKFPEITYTTQNETVILRPTTTAEVFSSDNVHYLQVGYNAVGIDIARNIVAFLENEDETPEVTILTNNGQTAVESTLELNYNIPVLLTPVVEPITENDLTFTVEGCVSLHYPLQITATENGEGSLTVSHNGKVLKKILFTCKDAPVNPLSLSYDDRYDVTGKEVEIIDAGVPTSYQVGYGVAEGTLDTAVITLDGGKLIATGIGTAKVKIDGVTYTVTVKAAPISLLLLIGQSNMRGSEGDPNQSIVCPDGMVYSTYGDDRGESNPAMTVNNATSFAPSALTGPGSLLNVNGNTDCLGGYPLNSLTAEGAGRMGPDSGFAYEWVKQTGEKVWVVNAAHGGTSITTWQKGKANYEEALLLFGACQETLKKEIAAGHYTLSHMGYFWCQGCSDRTQTAKWYVEKYLAMHENLKKDLAFDEDTTFEFGGIIPVRVGSTAACYRDGVQTATNSYAYHESFVDLRMNGPRVAQYWMINNPALSDIWGVCNIGDDWVWMPDGTNGVEAYFNAHYENGRVDYTTQVAQKESWYTPTTPKAVHDSIHYNQIGYNEIGRESVRNALILLGVLEAPEVEPAVEFVSWDGFTPVESINANTTPNSETLVVPLVSPVWKSKEVTYSLSDSLTWEYYDLLAVSDTQSGTISSPYTNQTVTVSGHAWSAWETVFKPTPEGAGQEKRICADCGIVQTRVLKGVWQLYDLASHMQTMPEEYCKDTNLWAVLEHDPYYFASGTRWSIYSSGEVPSVTIPVEPGDKIFATSFGKAVENGHATSNGIRVTFFGEYGVVKTMDPAGTYKEFSANGGYLIAPEGAIAINVAMWNGSDDNELYVLNREHSYENGTCAGCGCTPSLLEGHLQQLPENLCKKTNLWTALTPENIYYTVDGWGLFSNAPNVHSVTFPVKEGERVWASSFGNLPENGNGTRITWFDENGVLETVARDVVYAEFTKNGYITVPAGAIALNVPMPSADQKYAIYLLDRQHSYQNGTCAGCGKQEPKPESFDGKVISILSASTSTFEGYTPVADGFNLDHRDRYPQDNLLTHVNDTWWMQTIQELNAKLGINDSWAGSQVLNTQDTNSGDLGPDAAMASITRIKNLGSNGTPDVILFFGGGNDMGRGVALGSFDPATAPTEVDLTATKWESFADAYVAAIMRLQYFYPEAKILAMTTYPMPSYVTQAKLDKYGPVVQAICEHYGVEYLSLQDCGVTFEMLPDDIHPNAEGMDYITAAVVEKLTDTFVLPAGETVVHTVTHNLSQAKASLGYYKGISANKAFEETLTGEDLTVTVTMGGVDITATAYKNGVISIPAVTGNLVITAKGTFTADGHLQQLPEVYCPATNLWQALTPENIYYTATGWGNLSAGTTWSITFPVKEGDRIWATSLGAYPDNGSTANGVRITWFDENGVLQTLSRDVVYAEFAKNGYVTAPAGAVALNVPMTGNQAHYAVYILSAGHTYANGICTVCGEKEPLIPVGWSPVPLSTEKNSDHLAYKLENGVLVFHDFGDSSMEDYGRLPDYTNSNDQLSRYSITEWYQSRADIHTVRFDETISYVGQYTLTNMDKVSEIRIDNPTATVAVHAVLFSTTDRKEPLEIYAASTLNTTESWIRGNGHRKISAAVSKVTMFYTDLAHPAPALSELESALQNAEAASPSLLYEALALVKDVPQNTYNLSDYTPAIPGAESTLAFLWDLISGSCGESVTYLITAGEEKGTFRLSLQGTGSMTAYAKQSDVPWNVVMDAITDITIEDGVNGFCDLALPGTAIYRMHLNSPAYAYAAEKGLTIRLETLRILCIGNSHTVDYSEFLPTILKDLQNAGLETDFVISKATIGSIGLYSGRNSNINATHRSHLEALQNSAGAYKSLKNNRYDLIIIQDYMESVVDDPQTFAAGLATFIQAVRTVSEGQGTPEIAWFTDWVDIRSTGGDSALYDGNGNKIYLEVLSREQVYEKSLANIAYVEKAIAAGTPNMPDFVIHASTIKQNAMSSYLGASKLYDKNAYCLLERDTTHLTYELGRYLMGAGVLSELINHYSRVLDIDGGSLNVGNALTVENGPAATGTGSQYTGAVNEEILSIIREAISSPLQFKPSVYTQDPVDKFLQSVEEMEWNPTGELEKEAALQLLKDRIQASFGSMVESYTVEMVSYASPYDFTFSIHVTHGYTIRKESFTIHICRYTATVTPPTCTEKGYTTYTCTACGESYVADETAATGHSFGDWQVVVEAQMTIPGSASRYCTVCRAEEEKVLPALQEAYPSILHGHLQAVPDGVYAHTNLWPLLQPENGYFYAGTHWGVLDDVISVTIPITSGDQIFASSFKRGIRITFFDENGILYSMSSEEVKAEYQANRYITVPDGAIAVNLPMWSPDDDNTLRILTLERIDCPSHVFGSLETIEKPSLLDPGEAIRYCENCGYEELVKLPELMSANTYVYQNDSTSVDLPYRIYYPSTYEDGAQYPIVLFYHGAGSRGTDNRSQVANKAILDRLVELDNCVIVAPQCDSNHQWVNTPWGNGSYNSLQIESSIFLDASVALLDEIIAGENIDTQRVYAIGLSMGGYATWNVAMEHPEKFAAIVPICGAGDPARAKELLGVAIWAFHGSADTTVPVTGSQEMIAAIRALGGVEVKYTEYAGVGHSSWVNAFGEPELTNWLFSQKKHIHSYTAIVTKPTCTEKGYTTYACTACGDCYVADETAATGHSYKTTVTAPTCTEGGYTTYTCHCGDSYVADKASATGHTFSNWETTTEATCTANGEQRRDCKNCDHYETKVIAATGHSYSTVVTKPTCTAEGYTTYTCHCGDSYVADKVPATGHIFGNWETTKEATCTADGEQRRDCKNCDH